MKLYRFALKEGRVAEVYGDIRLDSNLRHYVWSCKNYSEILDGEIVYSSLGPISPSRCALYIKGAKPL